MTFAFRNLGAPDLARRGLTTGSASVAILLLDIEADLVISDGGHVVWSEDRFPVAELARELALWLRLPDRERGEFAFDSMSYDVPGAVQVAALGCGWRVGSVFAADVWTTPVRWEALVREVVGFVEAVRNGVAARGIEPGCIPVPYAP